MSKGKKKVPTDERFTPRTITPEMAANGYNNAGRGRLIGYISEPSWHEPRCPYRRNTAARCACRIGLWQEDPPAPKAGAHKWFRFGTLPYDACETCGIIRRGDDRNKPCKGAARVGLRAAPAPKRRKK